MNGNNKKKISVIAVLVVLSVLIAGVFFVYTAYLNSYFQHEMLERLQHSVEQSRYDIEATIKQTFSVLNSIALSLSVRDTLLNPDSLMLLHEQSRLYEYGLMLVITPDGKGYGSNGKTYQLSDREYFNKAFAGEQIITEMSENRQSGEPAVVFAVPVKRHNSIEGVFAFGFPFAEFRNLLKNNTFSSEAVSYILLADGTIIAKTENAAEIPEIEKLIFSNNIRKVEDYRQVAKKSGFYRVGDLSFFASYAALSVKDWFLLSLIPSNIYHSQWAKLLQISIAAFLGLAGLLFAIILIVFFMQQTVAEELRRSEERYRIVSEQASEVIFEWNLAEDTLVMPERIQKKYAVFPEDRYFSDSWRTGDFIYAEDLEVYINLFSAAAKGIPAYNEDTYRRKKDDGTYGWIRTRLTTLFDAQKKPYKVVGVSFDVDKEMNQNLDLRARAERDSLTDLYNKGFTNTLVNDILAESTSEKNRHAFFLIDVDNFKSINDTLGHLFGDEVLRSIGGKLKKAFRPQDITGRVGGDEFAVFLRDVDSDLAIIERAEKLQEIFRTERTGRDKRFKVSGSIGIALYPDDGTTYDDLYKKADDALYAAKHLGKDRYQIYGKT